MNDTVLGNGMAAGATIAGVVIGYLLSRAQTRAARRGELISLLEAARWEVLDATNSGRGNNGLPIALPTMELIVQSGMLADLPTGLRQCLLQTRSLVTGYNESFTFISSGIMSKDLTLEQGKPLLAGQCEMGAKLEPLFASLTAALEEQLTRLIATRRKRVLMWLLRREPPSVTPRSSKSS